MGREHVIQVVDGGLAEHWLEVVPRQSLRNSNPFSFQAYCFSTVPDKGKKFG